MLEYSVVILNWKRPQNVLQIIKRMVTFKCVHEILVSNGLKDTAIAYHHAKVKIKNDYEQVNAIFGLDRRFYNALKCQKDNIIIIDDDKLIEESELRKILEVYERNKQRIVGWAGRNVYNQQTQQINYRYENVYGEVDIVITQLIVFQRKYAHLFFLCKPYVESIYKTGVPYGNGEDIFFSFLVNMYTRNKNMAVRGITIHSLPDHDAISSGVDHLAYRNRLCQYLYTHQRTFIELFKQVRL